MLVLKKRLTHLKAERFTSPVCPVSLSCFIFQTSSQNLETCAYDSLAAEA